MLKVHRVKKGILCCLKSEEPNSCLNLFVCFKTLTASQTELYKQVDWSVHNIVCWTFNLYLILNGLIDQTPFFEGGGGGFSVDQR